MTTGRLMAFHAGGLVPGPMEERVPERRRRSFADAPTPPDANRESAKPRRNPEYCPKGDKSVPAFVIPSVDPSQVQEAPVARYSSSHYNGLYRRSRGGAAHR